MQINKKYILFLSVLVGIIGIFARPKAFSDWKKEKEKSYFLTNLVETSHLLESTKKIKDTLKNKPVLSKKDTIKDSISDTLSKKTAMLTDIVKYHAKDCVVISKAKKEILLYNKTNISYADTDLKAGTSVINYEKREAYAGRIKDSVGELVQAPEFKQGDQLIEPDSIRFNYVTKRAIIKNAYTTQSENKVKAETIKKENDSTYFLRKGKITTAEDLDDPDYYILVYKAKFVPKKKIVAGFSNMYIADVPTPIALPFAYYPMEVMVFVQPLIIEKNINIQEISIYDMRI